MLPPISIATSAAVSGVALAALATFARWAAPAAFTHRAARATFAAVFAVAFTSHLAWQYGTSLGSFAASYWGCNAALVTTVVLACGLVALPLAVVVHGAARLVPTRLVDAALVDRRTFLTASAAVVPTLAMSVGAAGFAGGAAAASTPRRLIRSRILPPALDGLRILQLSDLHLGAGRELGDLERLFARLRDRGAVPDLIVLTGDVAEDLRLLPTALDLVRQLGARHGAFAALGNHEHIHGVRAARRIFDASDVRLLVDDAAVLDVRGARLALVGVDDPIVAHGDVGALLRGPIDKAFARVAPADAFRVLLCHRPEGFEPAAAAGCGLTLSGHTHGGQIGFAGKSAFEPLFPDGYLWGSYRRGDASLYTTAGFGAWFPFRLGCPSEAPLLELRAGD